ncbi:MAG: putative glycerophosphoryl diester phosphodiesterase [Candidatus Hydrogenedentota bacterium]
MTVLKVLGFSVAVLGLIGVLGCVRARPGAPHGVTDVIAHRGSSAYAPENTLAAFKMAKEQGADWFELDCRLSEDGQVVVIHDETVDRTTNGTGYVRELALHDLQNLDAGTWKGPEFEGERIPTLGQALDFAKWKIGVYCEIKSDDDDTLLIERIKERSKGIAKADFQFKQDIMAMIEASGTRNLELTRKAIVEILNRRMWRQVVIQSFSPVICAIVAIEAPQIRVEYLGGEDPDVPGSWEEYLRMGYLLDVDGFNINRQSVTEGRIAAFHEAGKTCAVWTVDELEEIDRLITWGVDGVISNKPEIVFNSTREKQWVGAPYKAK